MIYYSTQRPVSPGTFPKPDNTDRWHGIKLIRIHNFDCRRFVDEIGQMAWGYIEYSERIPMQEAFEYELVPLSGVSGKNPKSF